MVQNSLYPAFVEIDYSNTRGNHTMTRPTRPWTGTPWQAAGLYENWNGANIAADTMIVALVDLMLPLFTTETFFNAFTIYTQASPLSDPVPVWAALITGKQGAITPTSQWLGFQKSYTFTTADNGVARLTLLDVPTGGVVSKAYTVTGAEATLVAGFISAGNAWSGRDDEKPVVFRTLSNSVNKALKKRYRL